MANLHAKAMANPVTIPTQSLIRKARSEDGSQQRLWTGHTSIGATMMRKLGASYVRKEPTYKDKGGASPSQGEDFRAHLWKAITEAQNNNMLSRELSVNKTYVRHETGGKKNANNTAVETQARLPGKAPSSDTPIRTAATAKSSREHK